jgi:predicted permease
MGATIQDLRFALRGLTAAPGFALTVIATLALGIGANTAIFSVVSGVLLRPLPFADPDRLVQIRETQPPSGDQGGFDGPVVYKDFYQWRTAAGMLEGLLTYRTSSASLQSEGEAEQVATVAAEHGLFDLLGVAPLLGRTFREGDPPNVAVISHRLWREHFGGDPSVVGRTVALDGQQLMLIGVMPEGFQFPYPSLSANLEQSSSSDLWLPWRPSAELPSDSGRRLEAVVARLKPGVALEAARQELAAMDAPASEGRIVHVASLQDAIGAPARHSLLVLLGAVGLVLLVACVNVANLLLARTASRAREIATRSALGAGRGRLVRQFLTESLLLAFCGGVAGLAVGIWGRRLLVKFAATQIPRAGEIVLDWRVFAFLLAVCLATGIGFGLAPAFAAARNRAAALKTKALRATLRDALVVVEIALAFVLLVGAGLLLRTFLNLQNTDAGLNADNVLTLHVVVADAQQSAAIEERVAQVPGVRAAGMISLLPLQNSGWGGFLNIPGRPELLATELRYVTPGYFRAMGVPLRQGREFSPQDDADAEPVILINEALAREYFPGEDPVGRSTDRGAIIGIVGDVRQQTLRTPAVPEVYYNAAQNFAQLRSHGSTLVVRGSGSVADLAGAIRAAVREASPGQALFRVATMEQVVSESLANPRLYMWLLAVFAVIGALMAVAGIYGVVAYLVALRTREFGIRMALGADAAQVSRLVLRRGAQLTLVGLALGLGGAAMLTSVLQSLLYGVEATDPATFASMAALLAAAALTACLSPARRAAQSDPAIALRSE